MLSLQGIVVKCTAHLFSYSRLVHILSCSPKLTESVQLYQTVSFQFYTMLPTDSILFHVFLATFQVFNHPLQKPFPQAFQQLFCAMKALVLQPMDKSHCEVFDNQISLSLG